MQKVSLETIKLKSQLEHLTRTPNVQNANGLLHQMTLLKNENFQFVQESFLTHLLVLIDSASGL